MGGLKLKRLGPLRKLGLPGDVSFGAGGGVAPLSLALPSSAGTPTALYTMVQPVGYSGPCVRVRRVDNGAEQDIGWADGRPDATAATSFAAGNELTIPVFYDASGNGFHATQPTVANQPRFRPANAWRGSMQGITFDSFIAPNGQGGTTAAKNLIIPAGVVIDALSHSCYTLTAPRANYNSNCIIDLGAATALRRIMFSSPGNIGILLQRGSGGGAQVSLPRFVRANPSINSWRNSTTALKISIDGQTEVTAAAAGNAGTMTGGLIGAAFGATFDARAEGFAYIVYPTALSDADDAAVKTALVAAFPFAATNQTKQIVFDGDSGIEGTGDTYLKNAARLIYEQLSPDVHYYNLGVHGTTCQTEYGRRVNKWAGVARSGMTKKVAFLRIGANDLTGGMAAQTLFDTYWLPYVQYIQSQGFTVIVEPVLPNGSTTWEVGGTKDNARLAFNTLIRNGAAANNYTVADITTLTMFDEVADTTNTTFWQTDKVHEATGGYTAEANYAAPLVISALAA